VSGAPARAEIEGIVLAGGPGRRLAGPKASVVVGGTTLVERSVATLASRCASVMIVSRAEVELPPVDAETILDRPGPDCPLNALATGLAAADAPFVLVLACDLPLAGPMIGALAAHPGQGPVAGSERGRVQPLCARYPRTRALTAARDLLEAGVLRAQALAEALDAERIEDRWGALHNVNTPADLAAAERLLG
jgi:molybdopterin-guanine dinucleotide biosynthesis protein A